MKKTRFTETQIVKAIHEEQAGRKAEYIYHAFVQSRTLWRIVSGTYKGKTQGFEEALHDLTETKIPRWEGNVFAEFPDNNETATEIFPQKRNAFYDGTYEDRVDAVVALGERLKEYAALSATQLEVEAYGLQLRGLRDLQQNKEGVADTLSTQLEQQRVIVATAMYGNLGRLMYKYRTERERIAIIWNCNNYAKPAANRYCWKAILRLEKY